MFVYTESGFIKSRHLDDKASVAVLMGVLKDMAEQKFVPEMTVKLLISNFEEVGFGASWVPEDVEELLAKINASVGAAK